MNPADRLIVALDVPVDSASALVRRLRPRVNNFKLGVGTFLARGGIDLADYLVHEGAGLMLDLKLYDIRDTVLRTMEIIEKLGAHWVTVHADCVPHAIGFRAKVLDVGALTDGTGGCWASPGVAHGIICSGHTARFFRPRMDGLIVCPGIRPIGSDQSNHTHPCTPGEAIRNGADKIVVGRPIYAAADPTEAARSIVLEIETALGAQKRQRRRGFLEWRA